jgi:hypothetical protein
MSPETTPNSCTCGSCACESAWQPIETAPKDGDGRGVFGGTRGPMIMACDDSGSIYLVFWNGYSWDDGDFHDHIDGLTHFMPLPKPPTP